ncbi:MAG: CRISPR-associated endoribonuclease Cas6 [Ignavibacteriaceae bacterium]
MRLKLTLRADQGNLISYNYHYHLSAAIYKLLQFGSAEFSRFLHDKGYVFNGKNYKLFTFALRFEKYTNLEHAIKLDDPKVYLFISSPLVDEFIKNFVIGTFQSQVIDLTELNFPIKFNIIFVETIPLPKITENISLKMLTPMVLSTYREHNGKANKYFLREDDGCEINRVITQNMRNKYKAAFNKENEGELKLTWNEDYIKKVKRITKKITINQHGKYPIDIIGLNAPFYLRGDADLIRLGYECGFGEKNSMGFGMVEVN